MRCLITGASGWVGYAFTAEWTIRHGAESVQLLLPPQPLHALETQRAEALKQKGFDARLIMQALLVKMFSKPQSNNHFFKKPVS